MVELGRTPFMVNRAGNSTLSLRGMRYFRKLTGNLNHFKKQGLTLARDTGNFILPAYPGLIVKDSYWRWPERNLAGNAIDFHVQVLGLSFHDAMRQITGK